LVDRTRCCDRHNKSVKYVVGRYGDALSFRIPPRRLNQKIDRGNMAIENRPPLLEPTLGVFRVLQVTAGKRCETHLRMTLSDALPGFFVALK
jgi:hypothetical protein